MLLMLVVLSRVAPSVGDDASPGVVCAPHPPPEALQLHHLAVVHKQVDVSTIGLDVPEGQRGAGGEKGWKGDYPTTRVPQWSGDCTAAE